MRSQHREPIAVNGAIVVGYKLAGIAGTLSLQLLERLLPPFADHFFDLCFLSCLSEITGLVSQLLEGMQAGVGAVIASVTL